jgi:hypothetical protein
VFRRGIASLLVALVALPFTAPFSTCDLSMLLGSSSPVVAMRAAISHQGRTPSMDEAATVQTTVSVLEEEQFRGMPLTAAVGVALARSRTSSAVGASARASLTAPRLIALRL